MYGTLAEINLTYCFCHGQSSSPWYSVRVHFPAHSSHSEWSSPSLVVPDFLSAIIKLKFKLVNWHIHIKPEIKNTSISSHKIWLTGVNYWKVCLKCLQFSIFKERVLIGCQTTNTSMICLQFSIFKERVLIGCQTTNTSVTCLQLSVVVLSYPHHFLHVVELLVEILFVFVVVLQRFGQLGKLVEPGSIHTLPVLQVVYNKLQSRFTVKMHSSHEERFLDLVIRGTKMGASSLWPLKIQLLWVSNR